VHGNSEWAALSHTVTERAVGEWRQRLRACVRAGGGHFEHRAHDVIKVTRCDSCDFLGDNNCQSCLLLFVCCYIWYEFIVVKGKTTTSAFPKVV